MIHSAPHIAISAPLLAPAGSYRSAGIHTYIQHSLQHLPEADPALRFTLFTAHPPAELPPSIDGAAAALEHRSACATNFVGAVGAAAWPRGALQADVLHATAFVAPIVQRAPHGHYDLRREFCAVSAVLSRLQSDLFARGHALVGAARAAHHCDLGMCAARCAPVVWRAARSDRGGLSGSG